MRGHSLCLIACLAVGCADSDGRTSGNNSLGSDSAPDSASTTANASDPGSTSALSEATLLDPTVDPGSESMDPSITSGPAPTSGSSTTAVSTTGSESGVAEESTGTPTSGEECSAQELELIALVNGYRTDNGLPAIPVNDLLCAVAHTHTVDLAEEGPHLGAGCTLRSWSNAGSWSACCYEGPRIAEDFACMLDKPRELTAYTDDGVEAVAEASTPAAALGGFQADSYSNAVLLNLGIWDGTSWASIGASIHGGFAVVWVGDAP